MISLDSETTGVDLNHGAMPFFVTTCNEAGEITFWEWDVDPLTRMPIIPKDDIADIKKLLNQKGDQQLVFQNPKFDVKALSLISPEFGTNWRWDNTYDTLLASHLLASNQPHDLTTLALIYLGVNIAPFEDDMEALIKEARDIAKRDFPEWRLAKAGDPTMPSAKEKVWKFDMWVPRAIAKACNYPSDHPFWTCVQEYANHDSAVTLPLYRRMEEILHERNLWEIYEFRLKLLPVIYAMEQQGVSMSSDRTAMLHKMFTQEAEGCYNDCVKIAKGKITKLPVNGTSNELKNLIFNEYGLEANKTTGTGQPSMDKSVLEYWLATLDERSDPHKFITKLRQYRKRKTAIGYIDSYEKFWTGKQVKRVYPSFNATGTDTLRFSSSNPNAQQISKQDEVNLRYCYGPAPGREWWSLDAKNIELRLPAYASGEQELIELFEHPDDAPYYGSTHLLNFHTVYTDIWEAELRKVGLDKVGPHCKKEFASTYYQWCKNGGFAVQYGAIDIKSPEIMGTADKAFHRKGAHALLKARFSRLEGLNRKCIEHANKFSYVETMPDITVNPNRGYPLLCSRSNWGKVLETVPLNYHIQGTAMWWMCKAMIRVHELLSSFNASSTKGYFIVMQVHDELVLDFPSGRGSEPWKTNLPKIRAVKRLMEQGGQELVPRVNTPVGVEYHSESWAKGITVL